MEFAIIGLALIAVVAMTLGAMWYRPRPQFTARIAEDDTIITVTGPDQAGVAAMAQALYNNLFAFPADQVKE